VRDHRGDPLIGPCPENEDDDEDEEALERVHEGVLPQVAVVELDSGELVEVNHRRRDHHLEEEMVNGIGEGMGMVMVMVICAYDGALAVVQLVREAREAVVQWVRSVRQSARVVVEYDCVQASISSRAI